VLLLPVILGIRAAQHDKRITYLHGSLLASTHTAKSGANSRERHGSELRRRKLPLITIKFAEAAIKSTRIRIRLIGFIGFEFFDRLFIMTNNK
jgi:hypothetical protein